jgi:hypothetical protein
MSSQQQPIEFSSLTMINRVLTRAGYRGTPAEVEVNDTSEAAIYLLEKFREGVSSEDELAALLDKRRRSSIPSDDTPAQVKADALDRWQDEGGAGPPDRQTFPKTDQKTSWNGRSIGGTIATGAVVFIGPEDQGGESLPAPSDRISLAVNGESWSYVVATSSGNHLSILSSSHTLTLVPADAGHPAQGEVLADINGASAWIVVTVVSARS